MPAKKKSKSALTKRSKVSQISRKAGNLGKAAAQYTRALRAKGISLAKKMELLEKRAEAYKVLGKLKEQAADLEKIAALQKTQIEDNISAAKQSRAELEILSSIAQALEDQADYRRIGQIVGEKVQDFFDAEIAGIGLYDEEAGMITVPYYYERGKLKEVPPFKYGEGVTSHVLKTRRALYLPTAKEAEKYNVIYTAELPSETMLMAPILVGKKALGTLTIQHSRPHAYGKHELKILTSIANSMAVAIENARLFDETTQRNAELAVINSVQQGLSSSLKFQEIIDLVGEKVGEIFNADTVFAGLYDAARDWGTHVYYVDGGKRVPVLDGPVIRPSLAAHVADTKKPLLLGTKEEGAKLGAIRVVRRKAEEDRNESVLGVPIMKGESVIGGISVQSYKRNAYTKNHLRLLETLASSMSVALQNAQLFDETSQRNAELAVINSVQESMAKQLDIKGIYEAVGEKIKDIFNAQSIILRSFDHVSGRALHYYVYEKGERFYPDSSPFSGLMKHLISTKETEVINEDMETKTKEFGMTVFAGTEATKSGIWVPLVASGTAIGAISLQNVDHENAFSASDVRLLETLANSMSVALENARLFDETSQRNAELAVINSVQEAMAKQLDIKGIYEAVGEKIKDIFNAQALILGAFDQVAGLVLPHYFFEKGQRYYPNPFPFSGLIKHLIATHETVVINQDFDAKVKEFGMTTVAGSETSKSAVFVPLVAADKAIGAISLQNVDSENAFSASDVRLLETLANSMSVALENARLFVESEHLLDESRKKEEELSTVNTVSQAVASELELASLIELIGVQVRKIFKADIAYLALYDQEKDLIEFPYIFGDTLEPLKLGEGITSQVIQGGKPVLINRDEAWKEAEQKIERVGTKSLSYLGVPILVGKRAIGAISVQSTQKAGRFDEEDQHLLSTIAANVGAAIENARLFAEVARQKKYFETFFQYSPAAVVVVDFNGNVISWNPAAEGLFGYSAQEAIGRNVDDLVANDPQIQAEARSYTKRATDELGRVEVIGRRTRKDGSFVDVEVKALPISVEGTMFGLLVIYHDISEIEQARRAAEEANQAKSAFLANMSHELRTPLNAIIGFTRIVRRKGEEALPEKQLENLDKVLVSAEHLLGLINTILDIAKIEAGRMELQISDFSLAALVDGCLATSQPLAKPGVRLLSSLPPDLPQMHSDEEKIRQVLLNLLSNAAKFTREGSIQVIGEVKGERISLAVQDSGIGIAPENLHKIFEEFQQADNTTTREYGGTGLGLSISRSLAKLLGGDLTVSSVEGQGSTFTLTIPMHFGPVAAAPDGKGELVSTKLEPDKPIVLVIDDQPDMFHILQQNLGDAGYQVVGALSGEEGIEKARSLHPFAITLDIMMPRKDGWQVLYELKNDPQTKDIPVIILTIVDNKPMGFRLGASDYLVKPLNEKSVLDALRRLAKSNGGVGPRKLLVVDDDPKVVDMVQQMLDGEGFAIESAADGVEALTHLKGNQPDAILLDLLMPRMDGFQLIDEIHKQPRLGAIPIIVLTAKSLSNEEQAQLEKSVASIVQKQGLGSETLIKEIHQIVS